MGEEEWLLLWRAYEVAGGVACEESGHRSVVWGGACGEVVEISAWHDEPETQAGE